MPRVVLPLYSPLYQPCGREIAHIRTNRGTIIVDLFGKEAPITVANFVELAAQGFYDGLRFHAFKQDSVIVGGCPVTRGLGPAQVFAAARGVLHGIHPGTGNARYRIADEWENNIRNQHQSGSLVMAHGSEPDSGSSQFYFSLARQPQFDRSFTVFGQISQGFEVLQALVIGDSIESITITGTDQPTLMAALEQKALILQSFQQDQ
jgi:peptidyl-prolyl cis-trans isomerase B (cyclophilin B)